MHLQKTRDFGRGGLFGQNSLCLNSSGEVNVGDEVQESYYCCFIPPSIVLEIYVLEDPFPVLWVCNCDNLQ